MVTNQMWTSHVQPLRSRVDKEREIFKQRSQKQMGDKACAGAAFKSGTARPCMVVFREDNERRRGESAYGGTRCAERARHHKPHDPTFVIRYQGSSKGTLSRAPRPCLTTSPPENPLEISPHPGIATEILKSSRLSAPGLRSTTPRGCISWRESDPAPLQHTGIDIGFVTMPPPVD